MNCTLHIKDESTIGKLINELDLTFESSDITVRELIKTRILEEVKKYNTSQKEIIFNSLVQPTMTERIMNGIQKERKEVSWEEQFSIATKAFENNGYFILINDKQADSLDMMITITPETTVSFIKLIPLIGG